MNNHPFVARVQYFEKLKKHIALMPYNMGRVDEQNIIFLELGKNDSSTSSIFFLTTATPVSSSQGIS